jgi:hypothetical protein
MAIRKPLFVVPLDLGTIATGNETAGFPASHLNRQKAIALTWKSTGNTNVWVRGQFAASRAIDFMAMVSANALPGTLIRLRLGTSQAEVDGGAAPYDSTALAFISPSITRDDGLYHSHLEIGAVHSATWWRIDITGHTGDFQAASLVLGETIVPSNFYNPEFEMGATDLGDLSFSRWGVLDETPGRIMRRIDFTLGWQTEAVFEADFRKLSETLGRRGIIYLCFDPDSTTYRQTKTYLGVFDKPPYARGLRKPTVYAQDFVLHSLI